MFLCMVQVLLIISSVTQQKNLQMSQERED